MDGGPDGILLKLGFSDGNSMRGNCCLICANRDGLCTGFSC
jgi:hypothetical protein